MTSCTQLLNFTMTTYGILLNDKAMAAARLLLFLTYSFAKENLT